MSGLTRRGLLAGGGAAAAAWLVGAAWGHRPLAALDSPFLGSSARATLIAACEVLLPDGAPFAEVAGGVDRYLAGADPVLGGQLVLALTALEHLGGVGPFSFSRFSRLDRDARASVLEAWRLSGLGAKRQIADAVRRVALFAWYTQPASWAAIGYDGPWVHP